MDGKMYLSLDNNFFKKENIEQAQKHAHLDNHNNVEEHVGKCNDKECTTWAIWENTNPEFTESPSINDGTLKFDLSWKDGFIAVEIPLSPELEGILVEHLSKRFNKLKSAMESLK